MDDLLAEEPENDAVLFETAQYYAAKCDYEESLTATSVPLPQTPGDPAFRTH